MTYSVFADALDVKESSPKLFGFFWDRKLAEDHMDKSKTVLGFVNFRIEERDSGKTEQDYLDYRKRYPIQTTV